MDGGSHGGTEVSWARGDVTEMIIMSEFNIGGFEMSNGSAESIENLNDTSSILHGDDSELILFVNPDEESLALLWKIPLPDGQSLFKLQASRKRSPSLKRK